MVAEPPTALNGAPDAVQTRPDGLRAALAERARAGIGLGALLDPSVVVSGGACLGALLFPWLYDGRASIPSTLPHLLVLVGASLVAGVVCTTSGRQVRRLVSRALTPRGAGHERLRRALGGHGIASGLEARDGRPAPAREGAAPVEPPKGPLASYRSADRILDRLDATLRQDRRLLASWRAAERVRVQASAHDGLAMSLLVWGVVFWLVPLQVPRWPLSSDGSLLLGAGFAGLAIASWAEATRLDKRRVDLVVASVSEKLAGDFARPAGARSSLPPAGLDERP